MNDQTVPTRLEWRKSSHSGANGNCVEVAVPDSASIAVRDSKDPDGPALRFSAEAWNAFVTAAGSGAFEG
ncbi:DUF397 domain-containing protein [Phaeacidiphilus oryzae]|jgi:hypothetical protein|uniref:DUF397 domain-containing protein n=1 Tax=Phaeacidiphilus oryzae TaxID=348818 RepID=UPI000561CD5F|nr:DUF397 domain-containing protein [Phaeacidiphilus oryzae]